MSGFWRSWRFGGSAFLSVLAVFSGVGPACADCWPGYAHARDCSPLRWGGTLEGWGPGDADLDGDYDADDRALFEIFATGPAVPWSASYYWQAGYAVWLLDVDHDGDVDQDDFGLLQRGGF